MTHYRLNPGPRMSEAVCVGGLAFLAGQVPDDLTADITVQTQQVLNNVDAVVKSLGGTKADIASVQVWLADMADFQGMNAVWDRMGRQKRPARPCHRWRCLGTPRHAGRNDCCDGYGIKGLTPQGEIRTRCGVPLPGRAALVVVFDTKSLRPPATHVTLQKLHAFQTATAKNLLQSYAA